MRSFVWVVLLAGCWTTGPRPAPEISNRAAPTTAPRPHTIERWVGTGRQYDTGETWEMELTIDPTAQVGDELGTIRYPELDCSGHVFREPDDGDALTGRERITEDPRHTCVDGGLMIIPRTRGTTFEWRWRQATGEDGAEATLTRADR